MKILGPELTTLTYDHGEVADLSVVLLEMMEDLELTAGMGAMGAALTLGRLLSTEKLDEEQERQFLEDILSFVGAYFAEGES